MTINTISNNEFFQRTSVWQELRQRPLGFIDIGARGNVHEVVEPIASLTAVLGFEPDKQACNDILKNLDGASPWAKIQIQPVAVADCDGVVDLQLMAVPTNHSLRKTNLDFVNRYRMAKFRHVGATPVVAAKLDTVLSSIRSDDVYWGEFIKIDTQGTEFEIFCGAEQTLSKHTVALLAEVSFFEIYSGQKLFSEIEQKLRGLGFSFYGFISPHHRSLRQLDKKIHIGAERLMQADAVFLRDPLPGSPQRTPLTDRSNKVLFICAILLGYYDFALELALATFASDLAEANLIREFVFSVATIPPEMTSQQVNDLAQIVAKTPSLANVNVGKFVDQRRRYFDYDDYFAEASDRLYQK